MDQFLTLDLDQFLTLETPNLGPVSNSTAYNIYIYIMCCRVQKVVFLFKGSRVQKRPPSNKQLAFHKSHRKLCAPRAWCPAKMNNSTWHILPAHCLCIQKRSAYVAQHKRTVFERTHGPFLNAQFLCKFCPWMLPIFVVRAGIELVLWFWFPELLNDNSQPSRDNWKTTRKTRDARWCCSHWSSETHFSAQEICVQPLRATRCPSWNSTYVQLWLEVNPKILMLVFEFFFLFVFEVSYFSSVVIFLFSWSDFLFSVSHYSMCCLSCLHACIVRIIFQSEWFPCCFFCHLLLL